MYLFYTEILLVLSSSDAAGVVPWLVQWCPTSPAEGDSNTC